MGRKTTRKNFSLYIQSGSDYAILDNTGRTYTPEEAREVWESGRVTDCNMAMQRFASLGFDVDALKQHYASGKR